MSKFNI
jgi:hypothetical protein